MRHIFTTFTCIVAILLTVSCSERSKKKMALSSISGKPGEIAVVSTKAQWEAEPGTTIRNILATDCPYLPQREPLYTLFNVPKSAFNKIFQVHRNLLYIDVTENATEASFELRKDVWAEPQTMLVVKAPSDEAAAEFITSKEDVIKSIFEQAERDRVIRNAKLYEQENLRQLVNRYLGGSPFFPSGYSLKKQTDDFIWISYETSYTNQGIFIYKYPYTDAEQLTAEGIIKKRDEVLKENVPASTDNSYMITNPIIEPGFKWIKYNNIDFAETRSLWDTHNDFMGGPFVSLSFLSKDKMEIIVIEGFVYAPKYPKRSYLRQVESIIYSFEWEENQEK